jgi:hypothetical protein
MKNHGSGQSPPESPTFSFNKRKRSPIGANTISWAFHKLLPSLQLTIPSGAYMLDLSTFLGHVSSSSTAVYLTITTELLECASERFAHFASTSRKECGR